MGVEGCRSDGRAAGYEERGREDSETDVEPRDGHKILLVRVFCCGVALEPDREGDACS